MFHAMACLRIHPFCSVTLVQNLVNPTFRTAVTPQEHAGWHHCSEPLVAMTTAEVFWNVLEPWALRICAVMELSDIGPQARSFKECGFGRLLQLHESDITVSMFYRYTSPFSYLSLAWT